MAEIKYQAYAIGNARFFKLGTPKKSYKKAEEDIFKDNIYYHTNRKIKNKVIFKIIDNNDRKWDEEKEFQIISMYDMNNQLLYSEGEMIPISVLYGEDME